MKYAVPDLSPIDPAKASATSPKWLVNDEQR